MHNIRDAFMINRMQANAYGALRRMQHREAAHMVETARDTAGQQADIMMAIRDLEKVYKTGNSNVTALKGINLDIPRGSIFGIIGLSGAGKSTLIRCINKLDPPTGGKVVIDGVDILTLKNQELLKMRR